MLSRVRPGSALLRLRSADARLRFCGLGEESVVLGKVVGYFVVHSKSGLWWGPIGIEFLSVFRNENGFIEGLEIKYLPFSVNYGRP